jgi:hypothetical protein
VGGRLPLALRRRRVDRERGAGEDEAAREGDDDVATQT